jgi:poly(hydroxyalkanoate) depolymerase family esterase
MNLDFARLMKDATQMTQSGDLQAATAAIQAALAKNLPGNDYASSFSDAWGAAGGNLQSVAEKATRPQPGVIDVEARVVPDGATPPSKKSPPPQPGAASNSDKSRGQFISGSFSDASTRRDYKLYIPPNAGKQPLPLVVMLHGCTQNPDDFATGTAMNEAALKQGFFVLYPAQSKQANPQGCWNWFKHSHQARGRGEPALLAGMTKEVMARYAIDERRVFVAGLSAGGAMAAIMGKAYPDIFTAVGVHSGLAAGAASDLPSALSAMSGGLGSSGLPGAKVRQAPSTASGIATIVFHGDADGTVNPVNGDAVIQASAGTTAAVETENIRATGQRNATRRIYRAPDGKAVAEHWLVHGAAHAWSGGDPKGSYTDPRGPDASVEMMRFFMQQARV